MALETRKFYTADELSAETLMAMVDELEPRAYAVLGLVSRIANETKKIEVTVRTYQAQSTAPLVGFADRTPLSKGFAADHFDVYPFHTKEGWEADVNGNFLQRNGESFTISAEGVVAGMSYLEERRLELFASMWHTVLNEKIFTWRDQPDPDKPTTKLVSSDWSEEIWDLANPDTDLDDPNSLIFLEIDKMAEEYFEATGFFPDAALTNGNTFNTIKGHPSVQKMVFPQATNEPDRSATVRDEMIINNIRFIALRGKYTTPTGAQTGPVNDGRAIITSLSKRFEDGEGILRHECAANLLNNNDSSQAYYSAFEVSKRPPSMALDMYDNGVPVIAHSKGVAHWQMY